MMLYFVLGVVQNCEHVDAVPKTHNSIETAQVQRALNTHVHVSCVLYSIVEEKKKTLSRVAVALATYCR